MALLQVLPVVIVTVVVSRCVESDFVCIYTSGGTDVGIMLAKECHD